MALFQLGSSPLRDKEVVYEQSMGCSDITTQLEQSLKNEGDGLGRELAALWNEAYSDAKAGIYYRKMGFPYGKEITSAWSDERDGASYFNRRSDGLKGLSHSTGRVVSEAFSLDQSRVGSGAELFWQAKGL